MEQDCVFFMTDEGERLAFYVVEQTTIAGRNYLLVADREDADAEEDAEAYIMREMGDEEGEIVYEMVEDEQELSAISKVFVELLEDVDIEME